MSYTIHNGGQDVESSDEGMHDCARGERCAARKTVVHGGEQIVVPAQTYRVFCEADTDRIRRCLDELPDHYQELDAHIGDKKRADGPRVSGGGMTPPVPLNLGVEAFLRQVEEIVLSWDERVRITARLTDLAAPTRAAGVTVACLLLSGHLEALLGLAAEPMARTMDLGRAEHLPDDSTGWVFPYAGWLVENRDRDGSDAGREILNLHHRALKLLGQTPQHHDLDTACWECGERQTLRRHDGSAGLADFVECLQCRAQYVGARLSSLMVEEERTQRLKYDRVTRRAQGYAVALLGSREGTGGRA